MSFRFGWLILVTKVEQCRAPGGECRVFSVFHLQNVGPKVGRIIMGRREVTNGSEDCGSSRGVTMGCGGGWLLGDERFGSAGPRVAPRKRNFGHEV